MSRLGRFGAAVSGAVAVLALTWPAQAQVRGQVPRRRHLGSRVQQPAPTGGSAASYRGQWTAARASFVLSAESLFGVGYAHQVEHAPDALGRDHEIVASGVVLHLFKGSELTAPLASARLGFDGVIGPGVTLGGGFGYNQFDQELTADGDTASLNIRTLIFTPRVGYLFAPTRYIAIWPRAGVAYINMRIGDEASTSHVSATSLMLDPMLVITPVPHAGLFIGPSLSIGLGGGVSETPSNGGPTIDHDVKYSYYGVSGGIGLWF